MKNIFIELTDTDGSKLMVNVLIIAWVLPNKNGALIRTNNVNHSLPLKVKESYEQVKAMIESAGFVN
ncbi:MAG: hypothetical protein RBS37_05745 [Bacteroidales bacterium]|jgi:hypothetical protein|nr:hypothetical protein [Bacteroidales bacterium]